ncbi:MAG: Hsp70 family protein [Chitinivibrionales bacterium]|nr:Hsp70 family protein [Chitinivibrionales bacterium]
MELIAGIDLGTTNSEIAYIENGKPVMVTIEHNPIMPSAVGLAPSGELIVGSAAKNQMVSHPESTVLSIKRKMGEEITVALGEKSLNPEEISSLILRELIKHAEVSAGQTISKAVITVPAYFNERQRQATKDAGELAGVDVVRIINEPTAAAMAYEAGHENDQIILVYDLGGGTFDASLVVVNKGIVEVKASHGDTHLGGDDFDELLIRRFSEDFHDRHGIDPAADPRIHRRLWIAAERAKRQLSDNPYARIREEFIYDDLHLDIEINRPDYEEMILPLLHRAQDCVHQCLRDAAVLPAAVDKIILVGGSSRTPLVHRLLKNDFGKEPRYEIDPDLIVAQGAAIQAATISGSPAKAILVDITPYTFGTSAIGNINGDIRAGAFVPVIHRNTPIPTKKSESFTTVVDGQECVEVEIYQGEQPIAADNDFVGSFRITGLSDVPAGNLVVLTMELDINGMLRVTAVEKTTGLNKSVVMNTRGRRDRLNIEKARHNLTGLVPEEELSEVAEAEYWESGPHSVPPLDKENQISRAKMLRKRAERLLPELPEEDAAEIRALLEKLTHAIASTDTKAVTECNESLSDMIFYLED